MQTEFNTLRHHLVGVKLQLDLPSEILLQELSQEKWVCWNEDVPTGHDNPNWKYRFKLKNIQSSLVQEIANHLQSYEVKEKAIASLYNFTNTFQGLWSVSQQEMFEWTHWHCEFMLDKPGFYLEPHNDYRRLVAAGMIYFNEVNDPNISTTFYTNRLMENPMIMTTNYGDGWLAINDYCNWHTGHNKSNYDRYSVLLGLTIKKPQEYD